MGGVGRTNYRSPDQKKTSNGIVAMTRWDSALEVFRHNPRDGSFATLSLCEAKRKA